MSKPIELIKGYCGNKRKIAPLVWQLLGDPRAYYEPFAGTGAVFYGRPKSRRRVPPIEVLNDKWGAILNIHRACKHEPDRVAEELMRPWSDIERDWLRSRNPELPDLLRADLDLCDPVAAALTMLSASMSAFGAGSMLATQQRPTWCKSLPSALPQMRENVLRAGERLVGAQLWCVDWTSVFTHSRTARRRGVDVALFVDPPYEMGADTDSVYGDRGDLGKKGIDYPRLKSEMLELAEMGARIVVTGYGGEAPEGWRVVSEWTSGTGAIAGQKKSAEVVWASPNCFFDELRNE